MAVVSTIVSREKENANRRTHDVGCDDCTECELSFYEVGVLFADYWEDPETGIQVQCWTRKVCQG